MTGVVADIFNRSNLWAGPSCSSGLNTVAGRSGRIVPDEMTASGTFQN